MHAIKQQMAGRHLHGHAHGKPDITPAQMLVLHMMKHRGTSSVKDVAEALGITSSAATQLVDGLVKSGYVERETNTSDRRMVTLTLSEKSAAHMEVMKKQFFPEILKVFDVLTDTELEQLVALHRKVAESFRQK